MTKLFEEFNPVSDQEWIEKISKDLKGKSVEDIAKTRRYEDIDLKVFYTSNDTPRPITLKLDHSWKISDEEDYYSSVIADPIEYLIKTGDWLSDEKSDLDNFTSIFQSESKERNIAVTGAIYQFSGASCNLQLALIISHLNEYFHLLKKKKILENDILASLSILIGIGSDYFMEIAKLRALRILVKNLAKAYDVNEELSFTIFAENGLLSFSSKDPDTNILRSTTACMSAVIGGCDHLIIQAHDKLGHKWHESGDRIARNIQLMMKHEAHLDKVRDAGSGSYYIEWLTKEIAEKAWKKFKSIEKNGGLIKSFKKGQIQADVREISDKRIESFKENKDIYIGINKYHNEEKALKRREKEIHAKSEYEALRPLILEDTI